MSHRYHIKAREDRIRPDYSVQTGVILATGPNFPDEGRWLLCDGSPFDPEVYPELAESFIDITSPNWFERWFLRRKPEMYYIYGHAYVTASGLWPRTPDLRARFNPTQHDTLPQ